MGYNNNHAGMHMVWHRKYAPYDDLEYYDKLMAKKESQRLAEHEKNIHKSKSTKVKKDKNNKKSNVSNKPMVQNKRLIADLFFDKAVDVYSNIFLLAFEHKLDIYNAVVECEYACQNDEIVGATFGFNLPTLLEKSIIYFYLLADKMGCDAYEFFAMNKEVRRKKVYKILSELESKYEKSSSVIYMFDFSQGSEVNDENEEFVITRLSFNQFMYLGLHGTPDNLPECHMHYYIDKISKKNCDEDEYALFVSMYDYQSQIKQEFHYMYGGGVVLSEKSGQMADFFENIYAKYKEKGGEVSDFLQEYL